MAAGDAGNTRLRSARQALGLRSQQHLADAITRAGTQIGLRISVTERTVRRWESDDPPWPSPEHQSAIESLFGRPVTELGFTPPWADDQAEPQERAAMSPAVITSVVVGSRSIFPKRSLADPLPGSVVTDYLAITSAYRHMYWTVPTSQLHGPVSAHVKLGVGLIASVPEAARRPLAGAVAESSLLAGRIEFFDMQSPVDAQDSFVTALLRCWRTWSSSPPFPGIPAGQRKRATRCAQRVSSPVAGQHHRKCAHGLTPWKPKRKHDSVTPGKHCSSSATQRKYTHARNHARRLRGSTGSRQSG
jgi:transcriptional regulator with XRE-family HTH domain